MTKTDNQTQTVGELRRVLESIAYGYDSPLDGRDAVMMRNDALAALSALPERGERISADGSDDDWPRALARLKATEPHPDQGIACVGTGDLAMALDRLQQFADVALGNAVEINRLMAAAPSAPEVPVKATFQERVQPWMLACFGAEIAADRLERNDRFIEEALELTQASGYTADRAHQLVDYVFGRPDGEINQEVGGVMVTLAAHCLAHGVDMHAAAETELARVWTKVDQIREKQKTKPKGSALPIPVAPTNTEEA